MPKALLFGAQAYASPEARSSENITWFPRGCGVSLVLDNDPWFVAAPILEEGLVPAGPSDSIGADVDQGRCPAGGVFFDNHVIWSISDPKLDGGLVHAGPPESLGSENDQSHRYFQPVRGKIYGLRKSKTYNISLKWNNIIKLLICTTLWLSFVSAAIQKANNSKTLSIKEFQRTS